MSLLVMQFHIVFSMNPQVVHIDFEPFFCDHVSKDEVHECLECRWGITETKEHDSGFKEAKGGYECSSPLILFSDTNVVIAPLDIELGKEGGVLHIINQLGDEEK